MCSAAGTPSIAASVSLTRRYRSPRSQKASPTGAAANSASRSGSAVCTAIGLPPVQRRDLLLVLLGDRLALELHRRRELVAARLPVALDEVELLDLLDPGEALVRRVDALLDRGADLLVARQVSELAHLHAVLFGPGGREVGVEDDQRGVVGLRVADHRGLPDERAGRLERRLDVGRRHVLAGRVDDDLLLAVD